jgi:hypothetical protein
MKKIALLAFLLCSHLIVAQADVLSGIYKENEVDTKPSFPGGLKSYVNFVNKNFNWTIGKYTKSVTMEFTVQTNGLIIVNNVIGLLDQNILKEALRVIGLSPKWKPATVKGKKVVCTIERTMHNPHPKKKEKIVKKTSDNSKIPEPAIIVPIDVIQDENWVYKTAEIEQLPEYPGGINQFYMFLTANFKMPEVEIKGKEIVSFIIEKDGSLSDIKVLRDLGFGTSKETIRVLKLARKWIPGIQNGKVVRVLYSLPIRIDNASKPSPENK